MKTILCFISVWNFIFLFSQQIPNLQWSANFGGTRMEGANDVKQTSDNGFILTGQTDTYIWTSEAALTRYWIVKTDELGNQEWEITLGGTHDESSRSIIETSEGDFIGVGYTYSNNGDVTNNHGGADVWVVKISQSGNLIWENTYGGTLQEEANEIVQLSDGNFMIVGSSTSNDGDVSDSNGSQDIWLLKIDTDGNLLWNKSYGGSEIDYGKSIIQTSDDGFLVGGISTSSDGDINQNFGDRDFVIFKLDASGTIQWQKTIGDIGLDELFQVCQNALGEFVAMGFTNYWTNIHGNEDYLVVKLDQNGEVIWIKNYGGSSTDEGYSITPINSGGYLLTGMSGSDDGDATEFFGYNDIWLVRIDEDGNLIWQKSIGEELSDVGNAVIQTSDNGFAVAGYKEFVAPPEQQGIPDFNFYLLKYGEEQMSTFETYSSQISIYPNPVKSILNFSEKLNDIQIYNLTGQMILKTSEKNAMNVDYLNLGTYILKAKNQKGENVEFKFLKN